VPRPSEFFRRFPVRKASGVPGCEANHTRRLLKTVNLRKNVLNLRKRVNLKRVYLKKAAPRRFRCERSGAFWKEVKSAREVIALLLPIAVAIAGGVWAVFTYCSLPTSRPHGRPTRAPAPASLPPSVQACSAARYCRRQSAPARALLHTQQVDVTFVSLGISQ